MKSHFLLSQIGQGHDVEVRTEITEIASARIAVELT